MQNNNFLAKMCAFIQLLYVIFGSIRLRFLQGHHLSAFLATQLKFASN